MASKTATAQEKIAPLRHRRQPKRFVNPDDALTPGEAKKLRHAVKQVREKKTKPWTQLKDELGL